MSPSSPPSPLSAPLRRQRATDEARALVRLGLPIVATQLTQAGMGLTDTLMAGRYSATDLAGVAIGSSLWIPILLLFTGILMGTLPLLSQGFGANDRAAMRHVLQQGAWLAIALGAAGALLLAQASPAYRWFGVDAPMMAVGSGYIEALAWGMPAAMLFTLQRCGLEALHQTRTVMLISLAGLLINIPLNYVLIYGHLGLPALGGVGCGWATVGALYFQLALACWLSHNHGEFESLRFWSNWQGPRLKDQRELLWIGVPIGIAIFFEASMFLLIALLIAPLGAIAVSGHQIAFSVISFVFMLPLSLSMAISIRVGFCLGRHNHRAARRVATTGLAMGVLLASCTSFGIWLLATPIAALYSSNPSVVSQAALLLGLAALFQLPDVVQVCAAGALRGYKDTRFPLLCAFVAYWLIGLPVGYSLSLTDVWGEPLGAQGFWIGIICGLSSAAVALVIRLHNTSRTGLKRG